MTASGPLKIFVLIDALGWQFLQDHEFLSDLLPYRRPLRTVLGFSSGAIPTILTGLPPGQHGHWNLFYYDPEGSPFKSLRLLNFLPHRFLDNRIGRKALKELGRRVLGLGPSFECCVSPRLLPYFNWVERRNIYDREGITGTPSIFDQLANRNVPYCVYSYHRLNDAEILKRAGQDLEAGRAAYFFLYLSELDALLHQSPTGGKTLDERLDWYAAQLRDLFQRAQRLDPDANLTIFSDHGMASVRHRHDLMKEVDALGFAMPNDYLAVYDSTMARFWFRSEHAKREINRLLGNNLCGRILSEQELKLLEVWFPDGRYGELIFLLHPGWLLSRSDFNGPKWMPAGMHGYHPDDPDSDASFLSNRTPPMPVNAIADVYRCLMESVGA